MKEGWKKRVSRYPVGVLLRRALRAGITPVLLQWFSRHDYDLSETLVVAGGPRCGTTWLAELVAGVPGAALLFEPLHVGNVPDAKAAGFKWRTFLEPDSSWPEGEAFIEKVLRGKVTNWHTTSQIALRSAIRPELWVVKLIHANLMLGWLAKTFPIRPPALIIRHPCAAVASRSQQGWKPLNRAPRIPGFLAAYPQFGPVLDQLTDLVEFRAALWCIDYFVPLSLPRPYPFHLVTYEGLVRNGARELSVLFDRWGLEVPPKAEERLGRPSQTTQKGASVYSGDDPLAKWRKDLSREEVAKILRVVEAFGLDFYSEALEPDYDRLFSESRCRPPDGTAEALHARAAFSRKGL